MLCRLKNIIIVLCCQKLPPMFSLESACTVQLQCLHTDTFWNIRTRAKLTRWFTYFVWIYSVIDCRFIVITPRSVRVTNVTPSGRRHFACVSVNCSVYSDFRHLLLSLLCGYRVPQSTSNAKNVYRPQCTENDEETEHLIVSALFIILKTAQIK
ncbi:hypothetical protein MRX96_042753 [Rhipicephalus microplus]